MYCTGMGMQKSLTPEKLKRIKEGVLMGLSSVEIARNIGITVQTLNNWKRDETTALDIKMMAWRREKLLINVESNFHDLVNTEDIRVKLDANKFIAETLGKQHYSKAPDVNINLILPTPIMDLGKMVSVNTEKSLTE